MALVTGLRDGIGSEKGSAAIGFHRWGIAFVAFGRTWGIGFDMKCDAPGRWWPIWTGNGDLR